MAPPTAAKLSGCEVRHPKPPERPGRDLPSVQQERMSAPHADPAGRQANDLVLGLGCSFERGDMDAAAQFRRFGEVHDLIEPLLVLRDAIGRRQRSVRGDAIAHTPQHGGRNCA